MTATRDRGRRRRRIPWGYIALLVAVLAVAGYLVYSAVGRSGGTVRYVTQAAARGTLTVAVAGNGSVVSDKSSTVDPNISGTVTQLQVALGGHVKTGQLLFVVDSPQQDANVAQARASYKQSISSVEKAEQSVMQADNDLDTLRSKQASNPAAVTDAQIDIATQNVEAADTGLSAAKSSRTASLLNYRQAQATAAQRRVTASTDGYVTTLNVQNGDQLGTSRTSSTAAASSSSGGSAPIVISDLSMLQAQVQIAETDRPKVKLGQVVSLTFDPVPSLTLTGKVAEIDAVGTSSQGVVTYGVTISFDVQDKRLSPGMTTSASIATLVRTNVILVPNAAVKTDSSGASYVQVLANANAQPQNVTVGVGVANDSQTEITSGLKGGEEVVVQTIQPNATTTTSGSTSGLGILGGRGAGGGGFRGPGN